MYGRNSSGDESLSRVEGEEMTVTQESLGSKEDAVSVLVDVTECKVTVRRYGKCTSHECQRKRGEFVLEYELIRVTGMYNGEEDGEGRAE